jgi:hypothetical protein
VEKVENLEVVAADLLIAADKVTLEWFFKWKL